MSEKKAGLKPADHPVQNTNALKKKLMGQMVEERREKASAEATGEAVDKAEDMGEAGVIQGLNLAQHVTRFVISREDIPDPPPAPPLLEVPMLEVPMLEVPPPDSLTLSPPGVTTAPQMTAPRLEPAGDHFPLSGLPEQSGAIRKNPHTNFTVGSKHSAGPASVPPRKDSPPRPGMELAKEMLRKKEVVRRTGEVSAMEQDPPISTDTKPIEPAGISRLKEYQERVRGPGQGSIGQEHPIFPQVPDRKPAAKGAEPEIPVQSPGGPRLTSEPYFPLRVDGKATVEHGRGRNLPKKKGGAAPSGRAIPAHSQRVHTGGKTSFPAHSPFQQAKAHTVRRSQHRMVRKRKSAPGKVKNVTTAVGRVAVAAARAVRAVVHGIAALLGLAGFLLPFVLIAAVAALVASPFGILYSSQKPAPGTIPVSQAVGKLNQEFSSKLDRLQQEGYDDVEIHGQLAGWPEILAVFAVKTSLFDGTNAADVVTIDQERVERLRAVFSDMNPVRTEVETIQYVDHTEYILHIFIESKTPEDMAEYYHFQPAQKQALEELLKVRDLLAELAGSLTVSDADASEILQQIPAELSPQRRAAVEKALELVGKVSYFWGGKSYGVGWDERWGTLRQVTAAGSSTTGKWLPFGLDCSGYLDWTFRNAGLQSDGHWYIGTNLTETNWETAQPGDIVLNADASHLGIVVSRSSSGKVMVTHCSYSLNVVAISDAQAFGFTQVGTPNIY